MPPGPLHCTQRATKLSLIPLVSWLFIYNPAPTPEPFYILFAWQLQALVEEWGVEVSVGDCG